MLNGSLCAVDIDSGDEEWSFNTADSTVASPIVVDEPVYFGSNGGSFETDRSLYSLDTGGDDSNEDSRVLLGTYGHHGNVNFGGDTSGDSTDSDVTGGEPDNEVLGFGFGGAI